MILKKCWEPQIKHLLKGTAWTVFITQNLPHNCNFFENEKKGIAVLLPLCSIELQTAINCMYRYIFKGTCFQLS